MNEIQQLIELKNKKRLEQLQADNAARETVEAAKVSVVDTTLPDDLESDSRQTFSKLLVTKTTDFVRTNTATITSLLVLFGVDQKLAAQLQELQAQGGQAFNEAIQKIVCPNTQTLQSIVNTRNQVAQSAEKLADGIQTVQSIVNSLNLFLDGSITLLQLTQTLIQVTQASVALIPPGAVPGAAVSGLSTLQSLINKILFTVDGEPRLTRLRIVINLASYYLLIASQILKKFIASFVLLDALLAKCGQNLTPISARVTQLADLYKAPQQRADQPENYRGFTLIIESKPFSQTLTQKRAVALNANGIAVLETDYSFTTKPSILYDQLKLTIDTQRLKAD